MTPWPWGPETELQKARRIAIAYRNHFHTANPTVCDVLDAAMVEHGQTWLLPRPVLYDDTDAVTTAVAAELVGRSAAVIRRWAATDHPDRPGKLLPAFGWDGPSRTYLVGEVREAAAISAARLTYHRPDTPAEAT